MKEFLMNRKVQMAYFPIAFVCILIVWILAERGIQGSYTYILLGIGVFFFILDRIFKPWKLRRLERRQREKEAAEAENSETDS